MSPLAVAAYYHAPIEQFLAQSDDEVIGTLSIRASGAESTQVSAWLEELRILRTALPGISGHLYLEFTVPRLGSRIDAVILTGSAAFVLEFKAGQAQFTQADTNQAWDYALDLKNFHEASRDLALFPILIATAATTAGRAFGPHSPDLVYPPAQCGSDGLRALLLGHIPLAKEFSIDATAWLTSRYRPTPTIIEAARALYAEHSVDAITRNDADAQNLSQTSQAIDVLIETAAQKGEKVAIFVTGVPGAGKTLVGLNTATQHRDETTTHAVFLSGNGPLVDVLRAALVQDGTARAKRAGAEVRAGEVQQQVKAFIQNVHHFRDAGLRDSGPPADRVAIFDEAQRAWSARETASFMKRKKGLPDFSHSEPAFLLSCMDRHPDWAAVVCLVGDGQEINRGEAGIAGWLEALGEDNSRWTAYVPPQLFSTAFSSEQALSILKAKGRVHFRPELHLATSMRSFRAERLSAFVRAALDLDTSSAKRELEQIAQRYPIAVTRDLEAARAWLRARARGTERVGLLASSRAMRLRPHAIDVRVKVNPVHWFLKPSDDVRSSDFLEDAATEFQVQGLEVDWACVTWDADLRLGPSAWTHHDFQGTRWNTVRQADNKRFIVNAYRVLLTRARQGMVIFVPPGKQSDPTRQPVFYDATYGYLRELGVPTV